MNKVSSAYFHTCPVIRYLCPTNPGLHMSTNKDYRCVQDWLSEKDMLLTSHLEHELTVDDLPDETQVQLKLSMRGEGGLPLLSKPNHSLKFKSRGYLLGSL